MTPEKQDKTLELSKHWSVDSTPARNEECMLSIMVSVLSIMEFIEHCFRPIRNILAKLAFFQEFFQRGQNLLLCKFLLLCYCFWTKFQEGEVSRGHTASGGAPLWKKASQMGLHIGISCSSSNIPTYLTNIFHIGLKSVL